MSESLHQFCLHLLLCSLLMKTCPLSCGGYRMWMKSETDVTSLWLSVEFNLLGNGWAYAIVCKPTGVLSLELTYVVCCCSLQTNSEMIRREFNCSVEGPCAKCVELQARWTATNRGLIVKPGIFNYRFSRAKFSTQEIPLGQKFSIPYYKRRWIKTLERIWTYCEALIFLQTQTTHTVFETWSWLLSVNK